MLFGRTVYQVVAEGKEGSSIMGTYSSFKKAQKEIGRLIREDKWEPGDHMIWHLENGEHGMDIFERFVIEAYDVK